jgi:hypothetical protein
MAAEDFLLPAEHAQRRAARPAGHATLTSPPARKLATGVLVACYAWVAAASAPFSTRALFAVLIPGAVLGGIAYGRSPERIPAPESLDVAGFSYWIVALALLFEWEASAFRGGVAPWHPSLTDLINPLISPHPVRTAAFAIWLLSGWGLVKR